LLFFIFSEIAAQSDDNGTIRGRIFNAQNNEPVPFANVVIWGTNIGAVSDFDGNFIFTGLKPGFVELRVSSVGFKTYITEEIQVTNAKQVFLEIPLKETSLDLEEVVVKASPFRKSEESPNSLRLIGIKEIEKNPGGNRDISRVIQSFPGVSSSVSFRNDLIVRGGGSSENRFFLDGVEFPNLNHFSTQGASGGPVGIINVDFVSDVKFYSGAFPANRGDALSSVIEFRQKDGNQEKLKFRGTVGASDLALTLDGPVNDNTTFIASARRSYLQFLFSAIGLPFLPTYNDFQFKTKTRINDKNELTIIGLGALDQFELNLEANETEEQRYILDFLPVNEQWNYTIGAVYKHFSDNSYDTWVISRNHLNNTSYKYFQNIEEDSLKTLDYNSDEIENKFRYEKNIRFDNGFKLILGINSEYSYYYNKTVNQIFRDGNTTKIDYSTDLNLLQWGLFSQASQQLLNDKLTLSLGFRTDANDYSNSMKNMFNQFSPRFSVSYALTNSFNLNFNTGRYFQLPPYTILGFKDLSGDLINRKNNLQYVESDHIIAGIEFLPGEISQFSIDAFYKHYRNYPFSVSDSIALANKGADFGTYGDEEIKSIGEGRAYGTEFLFRHKDFFGFNIVASYTLVRSEFQDIQGDFIPSKWDNKHLIVMTATKSFRNNWDAGFKWRFLGGTPYTPVDEDISSLIAAWNAQGTYYLDYSRFNRLRLNPFHQLDIRIDKGYYFNKWSFMVYLDIQNLYNFKADEPDPYIRQTNGNGQPIVDPNDDTRYLMKYLKPETNGTILPTIGIMVEF
ncbi:TonB-dependent receptor domain-containing protein, partial [Bacteroidota bacterium]